MKFRFRYYYGDGVKTYGKEVHAGTKDIVAATPVSAINQFHAFVQLSREMGDDRRTVLRPVLAPDQYKVESLHEVYHDAALQRDISSTPIVENPIDYPNSPNPDVRNPDDGTGSVSDKAREKHPEFNFRAIEATD